MFKKLNLHNIKKTLLEVSTRFPVAIVAIITTFILIWFEISWNIDRLFLNNNLFEILISIIAVFFLSSAITLLSESFKIKKYIWNIISVLFWFLFYFWFNLNVDSFFSEEIIYVVLIFIGILNLIFFSPFIKVLANKKYNQDSYYNYFIRIVAIFWMSFILGWALTILWFIWLWAIFTLFDLNSILRQWDFYWYFANFSLIVFTPIFFLSQLPKEIDNKDLINLDNFSKFLLKYIAIPFIYIYFFILYAYTIKVLLNFSEWPQWEVTWMVIWFSLFGYLIYIFSYWLEKENLAISMFRKYFPYAVIPQVLMLFYAIGLRIWQYDLTLNRYFVVVFWLCLTFISIYLLFSSKKKIVYIPMILFIFIITISIWPWGVFSLPESRQVQILEQNLIEAKILQGEKIIILGNKKYIDEKLSWKIYDLISYLVNNHWIESIENIFPETIKSIKEKDKKEWERNQNNFTMKNSNLSKYRWISSWELIDKLTTTLKVERYYESKSRIREELYFGMDYEEWFFPLDITGYDYITKIYSSTYNLENEWVNSKAIVLIDIKNKELILSKWEAILNKVSIEKMLETIYTYDSDYSGNNTKEKMTFYVNSDKYDFKLFIRNISLANPEYKNENWNDKIVNWIWYNTDWYALVKEK